VNLTWNAFAGATSYTIQRSSVSGGPYTTIQSGITGTSYTDSNVTSGNIYYYTILATTASGNTATVPEVVAGVNLQADTWVGSSGVDSNWLTAANWSTVPASGDTLTFAGSSRLSNTNNYAANTSFGGLMFNSGAGAFTLGGNAVTLTGNVTNNGANTQTVNLPVVLASGSHGLTTNTGNLLMGGVISGSGSLSKSGTGTATLSASNTYNGGTTLTAGTLAFGNNNAFGTGIVTLNGGTLKAGGGLSLANNIAVSSAAVLDMAGNNTAWNGNLSGSAALTLNNSSYASTLTLSGNDSGYSGTFTVSNGNAVSFNSANAGSANAAWVFNDAAGDRVRINIGGTNTINFGSISGSGQFQNDTVSSLTTLSVGALNTSTTFGGTIKDNGTGILALLKTGAGALTLSSASTYSGGTIVNAGELKVLMPTTTGTFTILGTGTIATNGGLLHFIPTGGTNSTETFANNFVFNGGTVTSEDGNTLLGSSTNTMNVTGATTLQRMWGHVTTKGLQLSGILQGSSPLTLQGTGGTTNEGGSIWINNAGNTYSGTVTVNANAGTGGFAMVVGANTALQNANVNLIGTRTAGSTDAELLYGVQFASGVTAPVLGSLAGNGNINLVDLGSNNVALNTGTNGTSTTFSGILSGAGSLIKSGTGTMTLLGANTYTGATTINGGILNVTGAISSGTGLLLVNNGGALAGTGSIAKAATVSNGGAISPGNNGAGTLTLTNGLTLNNGAVLNMELNGTGSSDKIAVTGSVVASGTTTINFNTLAGFVGAGTYPMITSSGSISAANFAVGTAPGGYACALSASNGTLSVTVIAAPTAPTGLTATGMDAAVSLNWNVSSGATSYTVWRSLTSGSGYAVLAGGTTEATNYTDTGLMNGTTYYYVLRAVNAAGSSGNSNQAGAMPLTARQAWRLANFGTITNSGNAADSADPDGDGWTNAQEFAAGTGPNDRNSALKVSGVTKSGNDMLVSFPSVTGKTYVVQRSDTLQSGSWTTVRDNIAGIGGTIVISDTNAASQPRMFYRVIVP
jgi:autotransporter-associated beta strand protein